MGDSVILDYHVSGDLKTLILSGLVGSVIGKFISNITNEFFFPVINDMFGDPKFTFNGMDMDLSNTLNSFIVIIIIYGSLKYGAFLRIKGGDLEFSKKGANSLKHDLAFMFQFLLFLILIGFFLLVLKTTLLKSHKKSQLVEEEEQLIK